LYFCSLESFHDETQQTYCNTPVGGISKPVIRGLGYNRIIVVNDGIRQEGQQWGDEHGIEVDGNDINRVEVIKGPASLMYGSDALAGVLIFHNTPIPPLGKIRGGLNTEYQTNNGLAAYSLDLAGHHRNGFVWDVRYSDKYAHAYKNSHDGYVPNSQFSERAFYLKAGVMKRWGMSTIKAGYYNLIPDYGLFDIGAYVTAIKTLNRWSISGGVRYDHRYLVSDFTRYFNGVTGSVGATFEASDHLDLKLNLSRGFRAPNISELAADGEHEGTLRYEIGNKDFDPEYIMQADSTGILNKTIIMRHTKPRR